MEQEQDYYKIDRLSNSHMSNFRRSPRHYIYHKTHQQEPTEAMIFGNAFHTYILENNLFTDRYIIIPFNAPKKPTKAQFNAKKPSPETIAAIEYWVEFDRVNYGKIVLTIEDSEKLKRMQSALYSHEPAMVLLNAIKEVEKPIMWADDITGVELKGKMDIYNPDFTVDLKTCMNAKPENFALDAFKAAYHRQAALYMDGRAANKMKKGDFYFIACEKEAPYGVSVLKCGNDFIQHGRFVYGEILEDFQYWKSQGSPDVGYEYRKPFGYSILNLPDWIK